MLSKKIFFLLYFFVQICAMQMISCANSVPLQELEMHPEMLWERPQRDRALNTCVICPMDGRDITGGWRNRPGSIKARAVEPASAFCHSATATLCVSVDLCCESYLVLSVFTSTQNKLHDGYKCNKTSTWARADHITVCVLSAWEQSKQSQLSRSWLPVVTAYARSRRLSLRKEPSPAFLAVPVLLSRKKGRAVAALVGIARWIRWRERRRASPYLLPFPIRSNARSLGSEARPVVLPPRREGSTLRLPSSEEVDGSGPAVAEARWRLRSRVIAYGSGGWVGDGLALSPPVFLKSSAFAQGWKPALRFFPRGWERSLRSFLVHYMKLSRVILRSQSRCCWDTVAI